MKTKSIFLAIVFVMVNLLLLVTSCKMNNAQKGGAIGAATGAGVGAVIGNQSNHTIEGAIIGAAVGGATGVLIGNYMDKQAEELRKDLKNARVERVAEGIKITFDSGILFATDSYTLTDNSKHNLDDLGSTLKKYDDTNILIEGHTDNTGTTAHNQTLSEKRARSVSDYLKMEGIPSGRLTTNGYGENQPIADNTSVEGKMQNRRVDIAIYANKKLKKAAEKGDISMNK